MDGSWPLQVVVKQRRNQGIDAARFIAAAAVVFAHALPLGQSASFTQILVWCACLPTIPFFFMTAGSFIRPQDKRAHELLSRPIARLLPIYLFWLLAYYLVLRIDPVRQWVFPPGQWLLGGPAYHLWFIPALGFALAFVGLGLRFLGPTLTGVACLPLAASALLRGAYHDVFHLSLTGSGHAGQYAAPLYVYLGAMLAPLRIGPTLRRWLPALALLCYGLIVAEVVLTAHWSGEPLAMVNEVRLADFPAGIVLFLLARSIPASPAVCRLASLGRISLGIYAVHLALMWLVLPQIGDQTLWQSAIAGALVLLLSILVSLGLQRVPALQRFVC